MVRCQSGQDGQRGGVIRFEVQRIAGLEDADAILDRPRARHLDVGLAQQGDRGGFLTLPGQAVNLAAGQVFESGGGRVQVGAPGADLRGDAVAGVGIAFQVAVAFQRLEDACQRGVLYAGQRRPKLPEA